MPDHDRRELHKQCVRRMIEECWHNRNPDAASEFIATNAVDHNPGSGQVPGITGMRAKWERIHEIFPDAELTIDDLIAEGDKVVLSATIRGTHLAPIMGIAPTGKPVKIRAIDILRFENGKIVEAHGVADTFTVLGAGASRRGASTDERVPRSG